MFQKKHQETIKLEYNIYFYPYRKDNRYECRISMNDRVYYDHDNPCFANTEAEAMEKAQVIFDEHYFESYTLIKDVPKETKD